jgi:hypothetical protein
MSGIRRHLTYANVMATLAVFIALGGTALASVIITSNRQVASGTISGHNPPTGRHANLIAGSVDGQDVRDLKWRPLIPTNGWVGNCFHTGPPAIAKSVEGVVYLRGSVCRNTFSGSYDAFVVPAGFRPTRDKRFPVDEGGGQVGDLEIHPSGVASVSDYPGQPGAAIELTSLDGASYALPF